MRRHERTLTLKIARGGPKVARTFHPDENPLNMKNNKQKSDTELKSDVLAELKYEPSVKVTDIGVLVKDGAVTLNGFVTSYGEKWDAVRAIKRVAGVNAIADDIEVKLPGSLRRTDGDIAASAANQLEWSTTIPKGTVQVTVREGCIALEGEVEGWYQKNAAETAVRLVSGVKAVANLITIKSRAATMEVKAGIRAAFERHALLDAATIYVETSGGKVILSGKVRSYVEREEAELAAWAASGVFAVDNQLKVEWSFSSAE